MIMNNHDILVAMLRYTLSVGVVLTLAVTCWADDITGEETFLCSSASVNVCLDDGSCISAVPWEVGVPDFIRVDLKKRRLSTTESSGENRATDLDAVERVDGHVYLHGVDRHGETVWKRRLRRGQWLQALSAAGSLQRADAVIKNDSPVLPVRLGRPAVGIGIAHAKP